jgi:hypothetical protein
MSDYSCEDYLANDTEYIDYMEAFRSSGADTGPKAPCDADLGPVRPTFEDIPF